MTNPDARTYCHRFVYEGNNNDNKNILLSLNVDNTGVIGQDNSLMLVGNPFMAHLDFEKFYAANKAIITPNYKILTAQKTNAESYYSLQGNEAGDSWTSNPVGKLDSKTIPPMQSFIVTIRSDWDKEKNPQLVFTKDMNVVYPTSKLLKSTPISSDNILKLTVENNKASTTAAVLFSTTADNSYNQMEDSHLLVTSSGTAISYIGSVADGKYLDINHMNTLPESLPIVILSKQKGSTLIRIENAYSLNGIGGISFIDTKEGEEISIDSDFFEYEFNNTGNDQIGRFYIVTKPTSINKIADSDRINIYRNQDYIHVLSTDGNPIETVIFYDLSGHVLYKQTNSSKSHLQIPASNFENTTLIIKANSKNSSVVKKVINY